MGKLIVPQILKVVWQVLHPKCPLLKNLHFAWFVPTIIYLLPVCFVSEDVDDSDAGGVRVLMTGEVRAITQLLCMLFHSSWGFNCPLIPQGSGVEDIFLSFLSLPHRPFFLGDNVGPRWTFSKASQIDPLLLV